MQEKSLQSQYRCILFSICHSCCFLDTLLRVSLHQCAISGDAVIAVYKSSLFKNQQTLCCTFFIVSMHACFLLRLIFLDTLNFSKHIFPLPDPFISFIYPTIVSLFQIFQLIILAIGHCDTYSWTFLSWPHLLNVTRKPAHHVTCRKLPSLRQSREKIYGEKCSVVELPTFTEGQ